MNYYTSLAKAIKYTFATEEDFQKKLDENPEDHNTRMVFADWLQDHDDPRAEGYRALGRLKKRPHRITDLDGNNTTIGFAYHNGRGTTMYPNGMNNLPLYGIAHERHALPQDWINAIVGSNDQFWSGYSKDPTRAWTEDFYSPTRKQAEDEAALAFSKLPPERQAEILRAAE